jgi:hypothetical protein
MRRKSANFLLCALYSAREGILDLVHVMRISLSLSSLSLETNKITNYNVFESFRVTIHSRLFIHSNCAQLYLKRSVA